MRNYIILNGKNSNEINGLLIQELPPISKPLIRTEVEEIDGRDGDIVTPLGYSAYDKEFTIGLYKDFDVNEVAAYFNSEGTVIFSNEPDKYYYYQITAQIDFERLVRYRTATVTMHCQPFKYSATEQPITEDVSGTVSDEGTNLALENTAEAPFNTLDLKGNTSQQTYSGKNLINLTGVTSPSGVTGTITDGSTIKVTGTTGTNVNNNTVANLSSTIPAGTYTFTIDHAASHVINFTVNNSDGNVAFRLAPGETSVTKTLTSASTAGQVFWGLLANTTYNETFKLQLVAGSTPDYNYEPYVGGIASPNPDYPQAVQTVTGENVVKICGKNLLDIKNNLKASDGGLNFSYSNDKLVVSGTPTRSYANVTNEINTFLAAGQYTLSLSEAVSHRVYIWIRYTDGTAASLGIINAGGTSATTTFAKDVAQIRLDFSVITTGVALSESFSVQLEKGSSSSSFEPYQEQSYPISLGSIKLCKIGDYQDYIYKSDGKWYVHKETGKRTYTADDITIAASDTYSNVRYAQFPKGADNKQNGNYTYGGIINFFTHGINMGATPAGGWNSYISDGLIYNSAMQDNYWCSFSKSTTLATMKEKLNGMVAYYVLATPTDTEITNEALLAQLDDIYYHAHSYKGRTHITSSAATGNVPHIIAAEVGEDNESTITNAGNYLSKPKITVYGSGDISLYINDMHVLQITLGDEGYITIDTAQMEAYKDTLDNLKNRLVIGDYSNARLKPGANKIHFTGTVTKYIVENYSRWL